MVQAATPFPLPPLVEKLSGRIPASNPLGGTHVPILSGPANPYLPPPGGSPIKLAGISMSPRSM
jgi:hypothetical protein